jgi:hypothetical protein
MAKPIPCRNEAILLEQTKLWATLILRTKIVMESLFPCAEDAVFTDGLQAACKSFDIAVPVVLGKHVRELREFSRTCFQPSDFLEPFGYTSFCIELFREEK